MKRVLLILTLLLFLAVPAQAEFLDYCIGKGEMTVDTLVETAPASGAQLYIVSLEVITNGTNDGKVILYDSLTASGEVITEITINGGSHFGGRTWEIPRRCFTGIYGDVEGVGASFIVEIGWR